MHIIKKYMLGIPIKIWTTDIEAGALAQAKNLSELPFAKKHIVLCADAHSGYGMPIGGVLATQDVVVPNAVGVDIGCGVSAVNTHIQNWDISFIKRVVAEIRKVIPMGLNKKHTTSHFKYMPFIQPPFQLPSIVQQEFENATHSIGTLGSGNHFLSLEKDEEGNLWVMLHSGSRNLGKKVADYYNKVAVAQNKRWYSTIAAPKEWDLAFLPLDTTEGQQYLEEMDYCVKFAASSRALMMKWTLQILDYCLCGPSMNPDESIDVRHNYAALENHTGVNYWIHRKGAIRAYTGDIGIIPGSMGTSSFIVRGLGNEDSFCSASHGAGRKMSRTMAKNMLSFEDEVKRLDELGIVHGLQNRDHLDEAPGSYKDIDEVMFNQQDLVEVVTKLTPVANLKG